MRSHRSRTVLPLLTLTGLLAVPLALAPTASAAPSSCQGRLATISSDASTVTGTEGPDVISVGAGTFVVHALGGDDVICSVAGTRVDAGAGNDSVVVTDRQPVVTTLSTYVELGPGDDTYVGTSGRDEVDRESSSAGTATGTDVISTGPGGDTVYSGASGEPNLDHVELGSDDDELVAVLPAGSAATFRSTFGDDRLTVNGGAGQPGGVWDVNLDLGRVIRDGAVLATLRRPDGTAGAGFFTSTIQGADRLAITGSALGEYVNVRYPARRLDVALGDGADTLQLGGSSVQDSRTRPRFRVFGDVNLGGNAGDLLRLADRKRITLDLRTRQLALGKGKPAKLIVGGVQDVEAVAADVLVAGSRLANDVRASGCRIQMRGARGSDSLYAVSGPGDAAFYTCKGDKKQAGYYRSPLRRTGARIDGGPGKDRLMGTNRRDTLIGGPGFDRANGGGGRDTCVAERRKNCER